MKRQTVINYVSGVAYAMERAVLAANKSTALTQDEFLAITKLARHAHELTTRLKHPPTRRKT